MNKILAVFILISLLSSCTPSDIGIIGGADGPTEIILGKGTDELEAIKMVNIEGELYYETGEDNETAGRCGTMDGSLHKAVGAYEIPKNHGEANFKSYSGYQLGFGEGLIEIPIDDDWEIFKRLDTNSDVLKYKYCYVLEGRLNNAKADSEFLVLANEMNITFSDAAYRMLGSDTAKMKDIYVLPIID